MSCKTRIALSPWLHLQRVWRLCNGSTAYSRYHIAASAQYARELWSKRAVTQNPSQMAVLPSWPCAWPAGGLVCTPRPAGTGRGVEWAASNVIVSSGVESGIYTSTNTAAVTFGAHASVFLLHGLSEWCCREQRRLVVSESKHVFSFLLATTETREL